MRIKKEGQLCRGAAWLHAEELSTVGRMASGYLQSTGPARTCASPDHARWQRLFGISLPHKTLSVPYRGDS